MNNNKDEEKVEIIIQDSSELEFGNEKKDNGENVESVKNSVTIPRIQCMPTKSRSEPSAGCLVIDVAFDARPPSESDFHGIKKLLQQLFVKCENEELTELSNLVVAQDFVGCVLKQDAGVDSDDDDSEEEESEDEDNDNVFAVNTVINISDNQNMSCIKKICGLLASKCEENHKEDPSQMAKLLGDPTKQIGLIISERFINIPPQVALPSYQSLKSDIDNAVNRKKKFSFTHLVLISKTYKPIVDGQIKNNLMFTNPEEHLFKEISQFSYTFTLADQDTPKDVNLEEDAGSFESLRTVMVFDATGLGQMILKLQSELSPA